MNKILKKFAQSLPVRQANIIGNAINDTVGNAVRIKTLSQLKAIASNGRLRFVRGCGEASYQLICIQLGVMPKTLKEPKHRTPKPEMKLIERLLAALEYACCNNWHKKQENIQKAIADGKQFLSK